MVGWPFHDFRYLHIYGVLVGEALLGVGMLCPSAHIVSIPR
jgi:hypothetical protein